MVPNIGSKLAKHITAEEAAGLVESGMYLDYGFGVCQPDVFDKALGARARELKGVKIRSCNRRRAAGARKPDSFREWDALIGFSSAADQLSSSREHVPYVRAAIVSSMAFSTPPDAGCSIHECPHFTAGRY